MGFDFFKSLKRSWQYKGISNRGGSQNRRPFLLGRKLGYEPLEDRRLLTTVFSDGFEGAFPGSWVVGNNNSNTVAKWGDNYAKAASGSWSVFCADNGSDTRTTYDNNLNTYLQQQNISLAGYRAASLSFKYWMNTEASYDTFQVNVRNQSGTWSNLMTISGNEVDPIV